MIHEIIAYITPKLIDLFEFMGIIVLTVATFKAFYHFIAHFLCAIFKKEYHFNVKYELANSMATALEFKLAAEILKTVIVRTTEEIIILGAIIILRGFMSIIIHLEMKSGH